jgi:hypothetical protein
MTQSPVTEPLSQRPQFILLRWYLRLFISFRFLWQVSRINLNLISTHPDRCAGLAFLGKSAYAFGSILFAQDAMLAGLVASRILYKGESSQSFKLQIGGFVVFFVLAILGPLMMFTPRIAAATRVESALGVSPRAAHRTGREPLGSSGSCHQSEGYRLPSKYEGSSCYQLARFRRW